MLNVIQFYNAKLRFTTEKQKRNDIDIQREIKKDVNE